VLTVPKIKNIHQKVLENATKTETSLEMGSWHTCQTTHCRAGWVTHLAGEEGKKLEDFFGPALAAAKIYEASSSIKVHWAIQFFEDKENAMIDIKRCAELEKK
jgi:hypothetical protein